MLVLLAGGTAVLAEEATEAGVTRTTVLLAGSSVCPAWVEDIPPRAGAAFSLVSRIPSVRSTGDRKQQPFSLTRFYKSPRNSLMEI